MEEQHRRGPLRRRARSLLGERAAVEWPRVGAHRRKKKQGSILGLGFYVLDLDLVFWIRNNLFSFFCSRDLDLLTR